MEKQTLSENTTCQSESYPRHSERSEESTCNREILARDVGEATSRTYRDTRKGTVVPLLQNDDLTCYPVAITRHSEAQAVPCGHPDSYGSPSACQRLKQESNKNPLRHLESTSRHSERSEESKTRILTFVKNNTKFLKNYTKQSEIKH